MVETQEDGEQIIRALKDRAANRLGTAISLGGWHGRSASADFVSIIDEIVKARLEEHSRP